MQILNKIKQRKEGKAKAEILSCMKFAFHLLQNLVFLSFNF